jgi:hypothetical protein
MARPDGRIEPGQPLRGAISAKAWNRAQDAADLVLGAGTGIEAGVGSYHSSDHVVIRIHKDLLSISTDPLKIGDGLGIGLSFSDAATMAVPTPIVATSESTLSDYAPALETPLIEPNFTNFNPGRRCGIIESISDLTAQNEYICRVRVRGIVRCRILVLTQGISVSPPPPTRPIDASLNQYWRRYLVASDYGSGAILALGRYFPLRSPQGYPRIQEAIVML